MDGSVTNFKIPKPISLEELKKLEMETGKIKSITLYDDGGMMAGYSHHLKVDFDNNYINKEDRNGIGNEYESLYYSVSDKELNKIEELILEYNLPAWSTLELNVMLVPSDSSRTLTIEYERENKTIKKYNIYHFAVMDQEERDIYTDFIKYIYSLVKDDKLIKSHKDTYVIPVFDGGKYCPECGKELVSDTCECGYTRKKN